MVVLRFSGGRLGNQMFEYATAYAVAKANGAKLALCKLEVNLYPWNVYSLDDLNIEGRSRWFSIPLSLYGYIFRKHVSYMVGVLKRKLFKKKGGTGSMLYVGSKNQEMINEGAACYQPIVLDKEKNVHILNGYWQSHKYFDAYRDDILRQFTPGFKLSAETEHLIARIQKDAYAVSVHVRRGDYLQANLLVDDSYYTKAVELMRQQHPEAVFYVFSDDIAYCKTLFETLDSPVVYAEHPAGCKAFEDIWAMSKCRSNIICNSTYSWWAAWLNAHEDKHVIVPSAIRRTNNADCICDGWIELEA